MIFKGLAVALLATGVAAVPHPEKRELKDRTVDCANADPSLYTGPLPANDPTSFLNFAPFAAAANSAPVPPGYTTAYTNLHATSNPGSFLGSIQLATYDTVACANKCGTTTGCVAFNIYFERDPTKNPATACANPTAMAEIKCIFWGAPVTVANANNNGQFRNNFQVVNTASNGYNLGPNLGPSINGYAPQGCYNDQSPNRGLTGPNHVGNDMTLEFCSRYCQGWTYFLVENAVTCTCGNTLDPASKPAAASSCNQKCAGNNAETCGGFWFMNLYKNPNPGPLPKINGLYTYQGCYTDGISARGLTGPRQSTSTNSLEKCATFCAGFPYFSVENYGECYCGNTLESSSVLTNVGCFYNCPGNYSETCGGFGVMNVYGNPTAIAALPKKVGVYSYQGCYSDNPGRVLYDVQKYGVPGNSLESCAATCKGYTYFGVEFGVECFCANAIGSSAQIFSDATGQCTYSCAGNAGEICGGFYRISIWGNNDVIKAQ